MYRPTVIASHNKISYEIFKRDKILNKRLFLKEGKILWVKYIDTIIMNHNKKVPSFRVKTHFKSDSVV